MTVPYRLHYAPDNASLIVRLALEELGQPYRTVLVDRRVNAQRSATYLKLNPNGLIPVLETEQGPLFETAAILLWLADRHRAMAPAPDHPERGAFLKWLVFTSNTLHSDMRMLFYPTVYVGTDAGAVRALGQTIRKRIRGHLQLLDGVAGAAPEWLVASQPSVLGYYLGCLTRWLALFPLSGDRSWFSLSDTPQLAALLAGLQSRPAVARAAQAEGLGLTVFTHPVHATPPEGSAT